MVGDGVFGCCMLVVLVFFFFLQRIYVVLLKDVGLLSERSSVGYTKKYT